MTQAWGCSKASWDFQRNKNKRKQLGCRENTGEVGRLQSKGRARDRACVERRHRKYELAWPGVTGQEGKHRGKSQRKWKQQLHSVGSSSQEYLLFFGEFGLF